jgi:hypothetical protein
MLRVSRLSSLMPGSARRGCAGRGSRWSWRWFQAAGSCNRGSSPALRRSAAGRRLGGRGRTPGGRRDPTSRRRTRSAAPLAWTSPTTCSTTTAVTSSITSPGCGQRRRPRPISDGANWRSCCPASCSAAPDRTGRSRAMCGRRSPDTVQVGTATCPRSAVVACELPYTGS